MINFSFVIPHKNQPEMLRKSISSIPHRDDVQIIVVDDNSDPNIVDFEDFPGQDDKLVKLIFTKEGKGAGYARNAALDYVIGNWIAFLGADDYFYPEIIDIMNEIEKDNETEVVFFKDKSICLPSGLPSLRADGYNERVDLALSTGDFTQALLYSCDARKFYKKSLFERFKIRFSECRWGNDVYFMGQIARYAQKYRAFDYFAYCSTESGSNLTKARSIDSFIVRFKEECKNVKILKPRYHNEESIYYWLFQTWLGVWKKNRGKAICLLPDAIASGGIKFVNTAIRCKFGK